MGESDRRSFAEGLISLGNLAMGAGVLTQVLPTKETIFNPAGLLFGAGLFVLCYWTAYKILRVRGGVRT
jgi:hypothetical protein